MPFEKGTSGNPKGRPRRAEVFEKAARRILDAGAMPDELRKLGLSEAALQLLPDEPTLHDALAAVLISGSLAGRDDSMRELLRRVWPAPKPVELSGPEGAPMSFADLARRAREYDGTAR